MKLVVIGGGGVRSPFLAKSIAANAETASITEVVFMDNDGEKLNVYGRLSKVIAHRVNSSVKFALTTDPVEALSDADFVITTIRVGGDECRVSDERIALEQGVLGQETTGAGGFGMGMRSIPVLLEYCEIIRRVSKKNVLVFNFTNPSGMITEALRSAGYSNVFGICDGPSEFIKQVVAVLAVREEHFSIRCYGLNHLSWFTEATVNGVDVTKRIIEDANLYNRTDMRIFDRELARISGNVLMNDYLQYYYYREQKIRSIANASCTRGEQIQEINRTMFRELELIDVEEDPEAAFQIYLKNYSERENSYGVIETGTERFVKIEPKSIDEFIAEPDDGGYAGVALRFIRSYVTDCPCEMVLSVPNNGALKALEDTDVVEISCLVEKGRVAPIGVDNIDEMQLVLIRNMKTYEKLAVRAITTRSRSCALKALTIHPLVNSFSIAKAILESYISAYESYCGGWS